MSLRQTLSFITTHPLNSGQRMRAAGRFFAWQVFSRVLGLPVIHPLTSRSKLIIRKGMTGATGNYYCGLHDFSEMGFLLHFLRKDDFFADVGANIGSYTVLAAAHCGASCMAFEPVPQTFSALQDNVAINHMGDRVTAVNGAAGEASGKIHFTARLDTVNHVVDEGTDGTIEVSVFPLDDVIGDRLPVLMKIDVEGYEWPVLQGAGKLLRQPALKALVIELNGSGTRYGYQDEDIHALLLNLGFSPYAYDPFTRTLTELDSYVHTNTLYLRDLPFIRERIAGGERVTIHGLTF